MEIPAGLERVREERAQLAKAFALLQLSREFQAGLQNLAAELGSVRGLVADSANFESGEKVEAKEAREKSGKSIDGEEGGRIAGKNWKVEKFVGLQSEAEGIKSDLEDVKELKALFVLTKEESEELQSAVPGSTSFLRVFYNVKRKQNNLHCLLDTDDADAIGRIRGEEKGERGKEWRMELISRLRDGHSGPLSLRAAIRDAEDALSVALERVLSGLATVVAGSEKSERSLGKSERSIDTEAEDKKYWEVLEQTGFLTINEPSYAPVAIELCARFLRPRMLRRIVGAMPVGRDKSTAPKAARFELFLEMLVDLRTAVDRDFHSLLSDLRKATVRNEGRDSRGEKERLKGRNWEPNSEAEKSTRNLAQDVMHRVVTDGLVPVIYRELHALLPTSSSSASAHTGGSHTHSHTHTHTQRLGENGAETWRETELHRAALCLCLVDNLTRTERVSTACWKPVLEALKEWSAGAGPKLAGACIDMMSGPSTAHSIGVSSRAAGGRWREQGCVALPAPMPFLVTFVGLLSRVSSGTLGETSAESLQKALQKLREDVETVLFEDAADEATAVRDRALFRLQLYDQALKIRLPLHILLDQTNTHTDTHIDKTTGNQTSLQEKRESEGEYRGDEEIAREELVRLGEKEGERLATVCKNRALLSSSLEASPQVLQLVPSRQGWREIVAQTIRRSVETDKASVSVPPFSWGT